jgi:hypothetical protein
MYNHKEEISNKYKYAIELMNKIINEQAYLSIVPKDIFQYFLPNRKKISNRGQILFICLPR